MRVAVVAVGDELLLGEVVDTNTGWIGRRLEQAGARVVRGAVVGDVVDDIAGAVRAAVDAVDLVVVTGGLGPTSDDVTDVALAAAAAPERPVPLGNPVGSAPGLLATVGGVPVVAVPGVPAEMRAMVEQEVVSRVADAEQALSVVQLHTALVGESELSARLAPVEASLPAGTRIAYLAAPAAVRVRFVGAGSGPEEAARHARSILGDLVVAEGDGTLAGSLCRALEAAGATLASAESLTGGLVGAAVTSVPGASAVYAGGVVAYATSAKEALLGVDAALLDAYGAVSPEVAAAMARGVRSRFGATYGVATTGVAGPDPQDGRPVGTVHVAVDGPAGRRTCRLVRPGSRAVVRERAVLAALELARRACLGLPPGPSE